MPDSPIAERQPAWHAWTLCLLAACAAPAELPWRDSATSKTPAVGSTSFGAAGNSATFRPTSLAPPNTQGTAPITDSEICNADVYTADRKRLDIYMMVDDSGSMLLWWQPTIEAIAAFFNDPASAGIGVGVQFFGQSCDVASYARPAVPIAALPGNVAALQQAFPPIPLDQTATLPALQGAIVHARQWSIEHPDAKTIVLLVTDGLPEECNSTIESVAQAAREGFIGTPSITTYVVGIGDIDALDKFAAEGGSQKALITAPGAGAELVKALNTIRGAALPCDFALPASAAAGMQVGQVNLRYEDAGGQQRIIGAVRDQKSCNPTQGGWYFDDPGAPKRLVACERSCSDMNAGGGTVKVLLGCPTVLL